MSELQSEPTVQSYRKLAEKLRDWFLIHARALPWRHEPRDFYETLVSEFMLQQTGMETVLPRFHAFLKELPTLVDLANAPQAEVLRCWEGLGYYRRPRMLHALAQEIVHQRNEQIPRRYEELLELPGIGPYTAAAISSLVWGEKRAVVDGNVERVLSRLFELTTLNRAEFQRIAQDWLLSGDWPGLHNEALMELGALVCRPIPKCQDCPLRFDCQAFRNDRVSEFPLSKVRPTQQKTGRVVLIFKRGDLALFQPTPAGQLNEGQWRLPWSEPFLDGDSTSALERELSFWLNQFRCGVDSVHHMGSFRHVVYNEMMDCSVVAVEISSMKNIYGQWATLTRPPRPLTTVSRKAISMCLNLTL